MAPRALTVNAGTGATTFGGAIGGSTALSSLTTDAGGSTTLNGGSIHTTGAQTYNDAVVLGCGHDADRRQRQLQRYAEWRPRPHGQQQRRHHTSRAWSAEPPRWRASSPMRQGTVVVNTTGVTTTGSQTYGELMTLGTDVTFTGTGLSFAAIDGAHNLVAAAGSGALHLKCGGWLFNAADFGGGHRQHHLDCRRHHIGHAELHRGGRHQSGWRPDHHQQRRHPGGSHHPGGRLGDRHGYRRGQHHFLRCDQHHQWAPNALTLGSGRWQRSAGGVVGGAVQLAGIDVSGHDLTLPGIGTAGDANQSFTALNNITLNQSRTLNAPISFTADSDGDGGGSFILLNGVSLTASNNALTITAADLDLQGQQHAVIRQRPHDHQRRQQPQHRHRRCRRAGAR